MYQLKYYKADCTKQHDSTSSSTPHNICNIQHHSHYLAETCLLSKRTQKGRNMWSWIFCIKNYTWEFSHICILSKRTYAIYAWAHSSISSLTISHFVSLLVAVFFSIPIQTSKNVSSIEAHSPLKFTVKQCYILIVSQTLISGLVLSLLPGVVTTGIIVSKEKVSLV